MYSIVICLLLATLANGQDQYVPCEKERGGVCVNYNEGCSIGFVQVYAQCGRTHVCCQPKYVAPRKHREGQCGESRFSDFNKIVGGRDANPGEWPWQVSIQRNGRHFCGGSIISRYWVATAAHCFGIDEQESQLTVLAGTIRRNGQGQLRGVSRLIVHDLFNNPFSMANDIALIQVSQPFFMNSNVREVCLPKPDEKFDYDVGMATGYGYTLENSGILSDTLKEVAIPTIDRYECANRYCGRGTVGSGNICGGFYFGKRDACQGDSGGPFVFKRETIGRDKRFVLGGITSWGIGCARGDSPGVYTKVADYVDWIKYYTERGRRSFYSSRGIRCS